MPAKQLQAPILTTVTMIHSAAQMRLPTGAVVTRQAVGQEEILFARPECKYY